MKIRPLTVFYEDFVERPDAMTAEIIAALGFPTEPRGAPTAPDVARQGDETNVEWAERFRKEAARQGVAV